MKIHENLLQLSGVVVDMIYEVGKFPESGEEATVNSFKICPGGGFNAMVAAKRSGMPVSYGGAVGNGPLGDLVERALKMENIRQIRKRENAIDQGCSTVLVEPSGERTFISGEGAETVTSFDQLNEIQFQDFDWMIVTGYSLTNAFTENSYRKLLTGDICLPKIVFDASPKIDRISMEITKCLFERANWISLNQREAKYLIGEADPNSTAKLLDAQKSRKGGVVLRLGEKGCVVAADGIVSVIPGHCVDAVDTTGAGDAHLGAFVAALAAGKSVAEAARYANIAAAISTTFKGPATAPAYREIEHLL